MRALKGYSFEFQRSYTELLYRIYKRASLCAYNDIAYDFRVCADTLYLGRPFV